MAQEVLKPHAWVQEQFGKVSLADDFSAYRQNAASHFQGFPDNGHEEWLYTPVANWMAKPWVLANRKESFLIGVEKLEQYFLPNDVAFRLVMINGQLSSDFSNLQGLPPELKVLPLSQAVKDAALQKNILEMLKPDGYASASAFVSLNAMFFLDGVYIEVAKDAKIEKPIQIVFACQTENNLVFFCPRVLVKVAQGSDVTLVETHVGLTGLQHGISAVAQVDVGENAHCHHVRLALDDAQSFHVGHTTSKIARNARYQHFNFCLHGGLLRNDINLNLSSQGIEGNLYGLFLGQDAEHIDNHTLVDHAQPHCLSNELYKGVLSGNSKGVFNGKIIVRQDAQKTNAFQENKNLLLAKDATINTKPQLEIFADDVKCTHGATIGQLDEQAYFYLMARGIAPQQAKRMLIESFAGEVLDKLFDVHPEISRWVNGFIGEKMESLLG